MRRLLSTLVLPFLVVVAVLAAGSVYTVDIRQAALVLRFGEVVAVREEPGLGFKLPLIDKVVKYDGRILGLPTDVMEITPADERRLVVDAFARWRISDVVRFRRAVGDGGIELAKQRLSGIMTNAIRGVLGAVPSTAVLSQSRTSLMNQIRDAARAEAEALGVTVIDVRLTSTDLPRQNLDATYARMRAEREREAADERARGGEAARRVRAAADRTSVELTSDARREAEIIRGKADATRNAVYAEAFTRDPEFFAFTRSMTAYERALQDGTTTMVIDPNSEFFSYLGSDHGGKDIVLPDPSLAAPSASDAPDASDASDEQDSPAEDAAEPGAEADTNTGAETDTGTATGADSTPDADTDAGAQAGADADASTDSTNGAE